MSLWNLLGLIQGLPTTQQLAAKISVIFYCNSHLFNIRIQNKFQQVNKANTKKISISAAHGWIDANPFSNNWEVEYFYTLVF